MPIQSAHLSPFPHLSIPSSVLNVNPISVLYIKSGVKLLPASVSTNVSAESSTPDDDSGGGLSPGAIAGIVVGCSAGAVLAAAAAGAVWRQRQQQRRRPASGSAAVPATELSKLVSDVSEMSLSPGPPSSAAVAGPGVLPAAGS